MLLRHSCTYFIVIYFCAACFCLVGVEGFVLRFLDLLRSDEVSTLRSRAISWFCQNITVGRSFGTTDGLIFLFIFTPQSGSNLGYLLPLSIQSSCWHAYFKVSIFNRFFRSLFFIGRSISSRKSGRTVVSSIVCSNFQALLKRFILYFDSFFSPVFDLIEIV